jgi:hypothetical protein
MRIVLLLKKVLFYTFAHLKRRINEEKNIQNVNFILYKHKIYITFYRL